MAPEEILKRQLAISSEIVSVSVGTLLLELRFFSAAVGRLAIKPGTGTYACDGMKLSYAPEHLLKRYTEGEKLPVHDILHMLMHCIFRHWNVGSTEHELWSAACDISAEALMLEMQPELCRDGHEDERAELINELSRHVRPLTAEKLYSYLRREYTDKDELAHICELFAVDDHSSWFPPDTVPENEPESSLPHFFPEVNENERVMPKDDEEHTGGGENSVADGDEESREDNSSGDGEGTSDAMTEWMDEQRQLQRQELDRRWQEIARQIQAELEGFGRGDSSEVLSEMIKHVDREKVDLTEFLRRFAVSGEVMRPDLDAFDYGYYCYGMELYGNVALIEPPEHKEVRRIKEFVIAIDTSGSVSGKAVEGFVRKTYSILKSEETFFGKVNIRLIQCDTNIREAVKITDENELERYIERMEIKGLGGTDFRPVFEYVDKLMGEGELISLKGLIYFTDGDGIYPDRAPCYDTAFVYPEEEYDRELERNAPPWVIKLEL